MKDYIKRFTTINLRNTKIISILVILLCVAILSLLHLHNGFPLLLRDSIGYLSRAFQLKESSHWSNTYSLFIAVVYRTFGTLQMVPFLQNVMVVLVLYVFSKHIMKPFNNFSFIGIVIMLLFTTLPWISTMLMSDIFTPISFLGIFLLLDKPITRNQKLILIPILFLSISSHQSHLLTIPVLIILYIIFKYLIPYWHFKQHFNRHLLLIVLLFVASNIFEKRIYSIVSNDNKHHATKS